MKNIIIYHWDIENNEQKYFPLSLLSCKVFDSWKKNLMPGLEYKVINYKMVFFIKFIISVVFATSVLRVHSWSDMSSGIGKKAYPLQGG